MREPVRHDSPNADDRPPGRAVDTLVLHYTGMPDAAGALARLCDPAAKVSAHYLIDEAGIVFRLVAEERRAWHAGVSWWRGRERLNDTSIGIELVNPGHAFGYRRFAEPQYRALIALARGILRRWPIPARNVVGHSDIAPERKEDPGELFDWPRLARAGIGLWPEDGPGAPRPLARLQAELGAIGYRVNRNGELDDTTRAAVVALQRHFRPVRVDGAIDPETLARLDGLIAAVGPCASAAPGRD